MTLTRHRSKDIILLIKWIKENQTSIFYISLHLSHTHPQSRKFEKTCSPSRFSSPARKPPPPLRLRSCFASPSDFSRCFVPTSSCSRRLCCSLSLSLNSIKHNKRENESQEQLGHKNFINVRTCAINNWSVTSRIDIHYQFLQSSYP